MSGFLYLCDDILFIIGKRLKQEIEIQSRKYHIENNNHKCDNFISVKEYNNFLNEIHLYSYIMNLRKSMKYSFIDKLYTGKDIFKKFKYITLVPLDQNDINSRISKRPNIYIRVDNSLNIGYYVINIVCSSLEMVDGEYKLKYEPSIFQLRKLESLFENN